VRTETNSDAFGGWEHLAPGVARRRLPFLDVTVGVVVGDDAVLLVDTGSTLPEGDELAGQVGRLTGRPVSHLVLTHAHFDHVFGAAAFPDAEVWGAAGLDGLLVPAGARETLRADAVTHGTAPAEAARAAAAPGPAAARWHPVADRAELDLGGRPVTLFRPGAGHTGHDLAVLVPGTPTVVFCGDLVEESGPPQAGPDALPHAWPTALDALLRAGGETAVYVPGHGAAVDARFVRAQRDTWSTHRGSA
jgi:glyoxylase-like metal-dependent hydrolase (beta-lactamase superfamily II)